MVPVAYPGLSLAFEGRMMGGKNPFGTLTLNAMVVHGTQTGNFQKAYDIWAQASAALQVSDVRALSVAVVQAQDPAFRAPYLHAAANVQADTFQPITEAFEALERLLARQ